MKTIIKENKELDRSLCEAIESDFAMGIKNVFIPAGGTPVGFYEELQTRKSPIWDEVNFFQVDDIINGKSQGEFTRFLKQYLGNRFKQTILVNDEVFPSGGYSCFLGLGMNGHVAFHEPHLPPEFFKGCVELGAKTLDYLSLKAGTWGVTYGLGTFLNAEKIYLMVKGEHKLEILSRFLECDQSVPAVALKKHPELYLMVDEKTWQKVDKSFNDSLAS